MADNPIMGQFRDTYALRAHNEKMAKELITLGDYSVSLNWCGVHENEPYLASVGTTIEVAKGKALYHNTNGHPALLIFNGKGMMIAKAWLIYGRFDEQTTEVPVLATYQNGKESGKYFNHEEALEPFMECLQALDISRRMYTKSFLSLSNTPGR